MTVRRSLVIAGAGIAVALLLAAVVAPFASTAPDGLERVAAEHGIAAAPTPTWDKAPIPDYTMPGVDRERTATGLAGFVGTLVVLVLALGLGLALRRRP